MHHRKCSQVKLLIRHAVLQEKKVVRHDNDAVKLQTPEHGLCQMKMQRNHVTGNRIC